MEKRMKARFFKYLVSHYDRMTENKLIEMIENAKVRLSLNGYFTEDVLETVVLELKEEGTSYATILAHLDLLDIDDRT